MKVNWLSWVLVPTMHNNFLNFLFCVFVYVLVLVRNMALFCFFFLSYVSFWTRFSPKTQCIYFFFEHNDLGGWLVWPQRGTEEKPCFESLLCTILIPFLLEAVGRSLALDCKKKTIPYICSFGNLKQNLPAFSESHFKKEGAFCYFRIGHSKSLEFFLQHSFFLKFKKRKLFTF